MLGSVKNHTLFALTQGKVVFKQKQNNKTFVSVQPLSKAAE